MTRNAKSDDPMPARPPLSGRMTRIKPSGGLPSGVCQLVVSIESMYKPAGSASDTSLPPRTSPLTWAPMCGSLDRYGHLYPDDLETIATAFDAAAQTTADRLRTAPALKVVVSAGETV